MESLRKLVGKWVFLQCLHGLGVDHVQTRLGTVEVVGDTNQDAVVLGFASRIGDEFDFLGKGHGRGPLGGEVSELVVVLDDGPGI